MNLCTLAVHGPRALRPFPDAEASVSRCGSPVREITCEFRKRELIFRKELGLAKSVANQTARFFFDRVKSRVQLSGRGRNTFPTQHPDSSFPNPVVEMVRITRFKHSV